MAMYTFMIHRHALIHKDCFIVTVPQGSTSGKKKKKVKSIFPFSQAHGYLHLCSPSNNVIRRYIDKPKKRCRGKTVNTSK